MFCNKCVAYLQNEYRYYVHTHYHHHHNKNDPNPILHIPPLHISPRPKLGFQNEIRAPSRGGGYPITLELPFGYPWATSP